MRSIRRRSPCRLLTSAFVLLPLLLLLLDGTQLARALRCDRSPEGSGANKSPADGRFRLRISGNPEKYVPGESYTCEYCHQSFVFFAVLFSLLSAYFRFISDRLSLSDGQSGAVFSPSHLYAAKCHKSLFREPSSHGAPGHQIQLSIRARFSVIIIITGTRAKGSGRRFMALDYPPAGHFAVRRVRQSEAFTSFTFRLSPHPPSALSRGRPARVEGLSPLSHTKSNSLASTQHAPDGSIYLLHLSLPTRSNLKSNRINREKPSGRNERETTRTPSEVQVSILDSASVIEGSRRQDASRSEQKVEGPCSTFRFRCARKGEWANPEKASLVIWTYGSVLLLSLCSGKRSLYPELTLLDLM